MATFYIDTDDFSTATAVWLDPNLTIKAADGFYSFSGIYRHQVSGILRATLSCPGEWCKLFAGIVFNGPGGGVCEIGYNDCTGVPSRFTFELPVNPNYPTEEYTYYIDQELNPSPCAIPGSIYKISGSDDILDYLYSPCTTNECISLLAETFGDAGILEFTNCHGIPVIYNMPPESTYEFCAKAQSVFSEGIQITILSPTC
jgi:hypothetical protein